MEHGWPGNVRELAHVVENLVVTGTAAVVEAAEVKALLGTQSGQHPLDLARKQLMSLRELEQLYISWVLERSGGNKTRAAEILGVDPSTLYRREVRSKT
jgi:two-component system response regulator HydG